MKLVQQRNGTTLNLTDEQFANRRRADLLEVFFLEAWMHDGVWWMVA